MMDIRPTAPKPSTPIVPEASKAEQPDLDSIRDREIEDREAAEQLLAEQQLEDRELVIDISLSLDEDDTDTLDLWQGDDMDDDPDGPLL